MGGESSLAGAEIQHHAAGMDFYVVLERPGYRVAKRRRCKTVVGTQHKVTKDDAIKWFQTKFEGGVLNKAHYI